MRQTLEDVTCTTQRENDGNRAEDSPVSTLDVTRGTPPVPHQYLPHANSEHTQTAQPLHHTFLMLMRGVGLAGMGVMGAGCLTNGAGARNGAHADVVFGLRQVRALVDGAPHLPARRAHEP